MRERCQQLVIRLWAINRLSITLADEEAEWYNKLAIIEELIFDQDEY